MATIEVNDLDILTGTGTGDTYQVLADDVTASLDVLGGRDVLSVSGMNSDITFIGGTTRDDINYLAGSNTLSGTMTLNGGNDRVTITADSTFVTVHAGDGKDQLTVEGSSFSGTLNGDASVDTIRLNGDTFLGNINAGDGKDKVFVSGNSTAGVINGEVGRDQFTISGSDYQGTFNGGVERDIINVTGANTAGIINGEEGNDKITLNGTNYQGTVNGGDSVDTIILKGDGFTAGSVINGDAGKDRITMSGLNFSGTINGGIDNDIITISGLNAAGVINGEEGNDRVVLNGEGFSGTVNGGDGRETITLSGINNSGTINGEVGNDKITITGSGFSGEINGGDNVDTIVAGGIDFSGVINGGNSNDKITLSKINATGIVNGDEGKDTITVTGAEFTGEINGGNGADTILASGNLFNAAINGGVGGDTITVSKTASQGTIDGDDGNDVILVSGSNSQIDINGGANDDRITVSNTGFIGTIDGGSGTDTLSYRGGLDLSTVAGTIIQNIEVIDLGTSRDDITLSSADILAMSDSTDTLRIMGSRGSVTSNGEEGWDRTLNIVDDGVLYEVYTHAVSGAVLEIQENLIEDFQFPIMVADLRTDVINLGYTIDGEQATDFLGASVSNAGDVNGDGFEDYLVGAIYADDANIDTGSAYIVFGTGDFVEEVALLDLSNQEGYQISGDSEGDYAGEVASAGDIDGDGYDDLLIGAWASGDGADYHRGSVYLVWGGEGDLTTDLSAPGANGIEILGTEGGAFTGYTIDGAGDVNSDGYDDFLIGADGTDEVGHDSGVSYLIYGGSRAEMTASTIDLTNLGSRGIQLSGAAAEDKAGISVAGLGDVNGDGFDDLLVGAFYHDEGVLDNGAAYLLYGSDNLNDIDLNNIASSGVKFIGASANDQLGYAVSSAGDVNGDGFDDMLMTEYGSTIGSTYLVYGGRHSVGETINVADVVTGGDGVKIVNQAAYDSIGHTVSSAGDVNGDGYDDILIGSPYADAGGETGNGVAYVVFGGGLSGTIDLTSLGDKGLTIYGDPNTSVGSSVSGAGDIDGDGYDDLLVGAVNADFGNDAGGVYVIYGQDFSDGGNMIKDTTGNYTVNQSAYKHVVGSEDANVIGGVNSGESARTGLGDDTITVSSNTFVSVDAGRGTDMLKVTMANPNSTFLDRVEGVETIWLSNNNRAQTLELNLDNIQNLMDSRDLTDDTSALRIRGGGTDTLDIDLGVFADTFLDYNIDGVDYNLYSHTGMIEADILIQQGLTVI